MESDKLCGGKKRKPEIYIWKEMTQVDVDVLQSAHSVEQCHRILSRILRLESRASDPRVTVLLDLFYYLLRFCQDQGFSHEQTSCLFSVVIETHAACVDSPLGSPDDCFAGFQDLILRHAVHVHLDLSICYEGINEPAVSVDSVTGVRTEDGACERPEPEFGEEEAGMDGRIDVKEGTLLE